MSQQLQTLEYASGVSQERRWYSFSLLTAELIVLTPLALMSLVAVAVPRFERIFKDFHTTLPDSTVILLMICRPLESIWAWVGLAVVVGYWPRSWRRCGRGSRCHAARAVHWWPCRRCYRWELSPSL